jgi:hypothetical protein
MCYVNMIKVKGLLCEYNLNYGQLLILVSLTVHVISIFVSISRTTGYSDKYATFS